MQQSFLFVSVVGISVLLTGFCLLVIAKLNLEIHFYLLEISCLECYFVTEKCYYNFNDHELKVTSSDKLYTKILFIVFVVLCKYCF